LRDGIASILVKHGRYLLNSPPGIVEFTNEPEANALLNNLKKYPHAFVIACVSDRQIKAERAWLIPYQLQQRLGNFSFSFLCSLSQNRIHKVFTQPTPLHRFPDEMSQSVFLAIKRIAECYTGNASRIWKNEPSSAQVVLDFLGFRGIGQKIATMAANILAREFKVLFSDYYSVDVSVDIHLRRVFTRLGLIHEGASVEEIVYCARALHPTFPGLMDLPTWQIGRSWCRPKQPKCYECYMAGVCPTALKGNL